MSQLTLPPDITEPNVPEDALYEIVNGHLVEKYVGYYELQLASLLHGILWSFVRDHELGRVVVETLFQFDPEETLLRRPDLAFVSYKKWPKNRKMRRANAWHVVPELAVEVISPSNTAEKVASKIQEYFQTGVEQVWIIYPLPRQIYVHRSTTEVRVLSGHEELDGGDLLPGFRLPLMSLFVDELEEADGQPDDKA